MRSLEICGGPCHSYLQGKRSKSKAKESTDFASGCAMNTVEKVFEYLKQVGTLSMLSELSRCRSEPLARMLYIIVGWYIPEVPRTKEVRCSTTADIHRVQGINRSTQMAILCCSLSFCVVRLFSISSSGSALFMENSRFSQVRFNSPSYRSTFSPRRGYPLDHDNQTRGGLFASGLATACH